MLLLSASGGTPIKRASSSVTSAPPASAVAKPVINTSSVSGSSANASFFSRFLETVASPIRSNIKKKVDPASGRVMVTPPPSSKRAVLVFDENAGSGKSSPSRPPRSAVLSPSKKANGAITPDRGSTPKKRVRPLLNNDDEDDNPPPSPFGSTKKLGLMSPEARAEEMVSLLGNSVGN